MKNMTTANPSLGPSKNQTGRKAGRNNPNRSGDKSQYLEEEEDPSAEAVWISSSGFRIIN